MTTAFSTFSEKFKAALTTTYGGWRGDRGPEGPAYDRRGRASRFDLRCPPTATEACMRLCAVRPATYIVGCEYKSRRPGFHDAPVPTTHRPPPQMSSFLKINFYDQHFVDLKRLDPMRPMDLGDGPEILELNITVLRDASETIWNPLFGSRSLYTGCLYDGSTSRPVFVKWARSKRRMEEFKREGEFYCSALRKVQGVVVPNFYGHYAATGQGMHGLGCMILEQMDRGDISSDEIDK